MEKETIMNYSNGDITVIWKPASCIHSKKCWTELGSVFRPKERPWVKMDNAASEAIMQQVDRCPSGALSYIKNGKLENTQELSAESIVEVTENGPLLIYGNITVKHCNGDEVKKSKVTAFCRCGQSANKPYCDGTHTKAGFKE